MNLKPVNILLVEDNEGDIILTIDAFEECKIKSEMKVVRNGQEALDFLYQRGSF
ncbi:MAG: CheY-like chemotaxis protein [Polaribacter sp.]|jgi:CheY-like chemotaxis protein